MIRPMGNVIKSLSKEGHKTGEALRRNGFETSNAHSHSTNPIIWGCIFYALAGITFANLLIFHLLFLAANFLSIKIVSQRSGKCNCIPSHFAELLIEGRSISFLFQQYPFQSVGAYCPCTLINRHSADTIIFEEHIAALPNQSVQEFLCTVWM